MSSGALTDARLAVVGAIVMGRITPWPVDAIAVSGLAAPGVEDSGAGAAGAVAEGETGAVAPPPADCGMAAPAAGRGVSGFGMGAEDGVDGETIVTRGPASGCDDPVADAETVVVAWESRTPLPRAVATGLAEGTETDGGAEAALGNAGMDVK